MNEESLFLGHNIKYWLELQERAEKLGVVDYLQEITTLRGKIAFYESRIKQMFEVCNPPIK